MLTYHHTWPTKHGWTVGRLKTLKALRNQGASLRQCASTLNVRPDGDLTPEIIVDKACWAMLGVTPDAAHVAMIDAEGERPNATDAVAGRA